MKLEIKHIAPYLPYGIKLRYESNGNHYTGTIKTIGKGIIWIESKQSVVARTYTEFKPILKPLSDLEDDELRAIEQAEGINGITAINERVRYGFVSYIIITMLISNHYDIFELIDNGLAIDINEVKG